MREDTHDAGVLPDVITVISRRVSVECRNLHIRVRRGNEIIYTAVTDLNVLHSFAICEQLAECPFLILGQRLGRVDVYCRTRKILLKCFDGGNLVDERLAR